MSSEEQGEKPAPPVPPTDSIRLPEHEKTVGTRTLEQDPVDLCDCGGTIYYVERATGRVIIDMWDAVDWDSDEYRLSVERDEIERYQQCDRCGWRVDL